MSASAISAGAQQAGPVSSDISALISSIVDKWHYCKKSGEAVNRVRGHLKHDWNNVASRFLPYGKSAA